MGQAEVTSATREEEARREFWPWLAGAALGILVVGWWAYQRGTMQWNRRLPLPLGEGWGRGLPRGGRWPGGC